MNDKIDLKSCNIQELEDFLTSIGEKRFRARQVFEWIHKGIENIDEMTNLSKALREKLKEEGYIGVLKIEDVLISKIDGTRKYLFLLEDGNIIESVLMKYKHGNSVCVSTQVGCRMGCKFCASTLEGVIRNLRAGEILDQVLTIQKDIKERISNVVLMGSGEPFDNYDEVLKFLDIINHPAGLNISLRNITISTCGLIPQMLDLANKKPQVTLAISLHAPNDELRSKMMPINFRYPLDELFRACKIYTDITNRRITFEYALIHNVNDTKEHAKELSERIKGILCHVNLIPLNKVDEREFQTAKTNKVKEFQSILKQNGIEATIRRELGSDINAACGQLRRRYLKHKKDMKNEA
ncbi:23S rRNA (adenine(2503)-C(2))-methyltransferase RlmN [Crassaminicella thermophila]|uniref:Probable dual-specificity RNA methyltransferase RlmN n=1 Tax=Crassaminicella thermophila TaxID=2599308 RepID=A0A5C0SE04_CRATE|nr:23S rRNA (adenine(2503)-C(2))-methyltransferase RlmN [Crassaminicella thermophila]QEK12773.1 23S rRNA (adenine(2503)-C(2))-methyltransferase RlmN [Crassaminicella thermophila]